MVTLIELLRNLKKKIEGLHSQKFSYKEFDKWLIQEYTNNNYPKFYLDLIGELSIEIEGIQSDMENIGKRITLNEVKYSDEFIKKILSKINSKIDDLIK